MSYRILAVSGLLLIFVSQIMAQTPSNSIRNSETSNFASRTYFPFRKKASKEQKRRLQPHPEDATRYAQILAQPRTGIFRLFPDLGCEVNTLVIKVDENCLNHIPESSFYSFREVEYAQEILSDIRLKSNHLISDGIFSQGILVNLGDVALESITNSAEGLKFLNEYTPQTTNKEAYKQALQMIEGVESGNYQYKKTAPVIENATYALRVIAYKGSILRTYRGFRFDLLAGDKRIDLTLAFRIVRKDDDGGITIVWRELARRESPRIKFEKRKVR